MTIGEKAEQYHKRGFNCAQSVLCALGGYTGLDEATALALTGGLGGGLHVGEVCGALNGAAIALGLVAPYTDETRPEDKRRVTALTAKCMKACKEACGAATCRELLRQAGGNSQCGSYVRTCAAIAEQMILDIQKEKGD